MDFLSFGSYWAYTTWPYLSSNTRKNQEHATTGTARFQVGS